MRSATEALNAILKTLEEDLTTYLGQLERAETHDASNKARGALGFIRGKMLQITDMLTKGVD